MVPLGSLVRGLLPKKVGLVEQTQLGEIFSGGVFLTDTIFEIDGYRVPSKSYNPTILCQGDLNSTQESHSSMFCHQRLPFGYGANSKTCQGVTIGSSTRTTDTQGGNSLHCTAENSLPLLNFQVQPKHILSATSAHFFRYL